MLIQTWAVEVRERWKTESAFTSRQGRWLNLGPPLPREAIQAADQQSRRWYLRSWLDQVPVPWSPMQASGQDQTLCSAGFPRNRAQPVWQVQGTFTQHRERWRWSILGDSVCCSEQERTNSAAAEWWLMIQTWARQPPAMQHWAGFISTSLLIRGRHRSSTAFTETTLLLQAVSFGYRICLWLWGKWYVHRKLWE